MGSSNTAPAGPSGRSLALAMVGWLGLAACLAMVYLAMRAVMDIGGSCAEGGPYVVSRACPEGSTPALFLGIFGGMFCAFIASIGGLGIGGIWAATPLLAWSALFGLLGWNFLDYGVVNAPESGIDWGWAVCGVVFWVMAFGPLLGLLPAFGGSRVGTEARRASGGAASDAAPDAAPDVIVLDGPGQLERDQSRDEPDERRAGFSTLAGRLDASTASGTSEESREELAQIAADFGAAIGAVMAEVRMDPDLRVMGEEAFTEGTQALLDRLERLADMRDRGLLAPEEYETAKATIMAELEGRS